MRPDQEQAGGVRPGRPAQFSWRSAPARRSRWAASRWSPSMSTTPSRIRWPLPSTARRASSSRPATSRSITRRCPASRHRPVHHCRVWPQGRAGSAGGFHQRGAPGLYGHRAESGGRGAQPVARAGKRRIIVATFASNIYRVQQIIDLAIEYGRKVAVSGRSMVSNTRNGAGAGLSARAG